MTTFNDKLAILGTEAKAFIKAKMDEHKEINLWSGMGTEYQDAEDLDDDMDIVEELEFMPDYQDFDSPLKNIHAHVVSLNIRDGQYLAEGRMHSGQGISMIQVDDLLDNEACELADFLKRFLDLEYDVISPDGFSIDRTDTYKGIPAARAALAEWIKRYEHQGYYSSSKYGRIELDRLGACCEFVIVQPENEEA